MRTIKPAEPFTPGEYLRDELQARGWTQSQFAAVIGRPLQLVSEIINGRKRITEKTALEISAALGTSARVWLNLENNYRISKKVSRSGDREADEAGIAGVGGVAASEELRGGLNDT